MALRKPKVSFFSKMKRRESEEVVVGIAHAFAGQMEDTVVAETLLIGLRDNTLHLFPEYHPILGCRLSLNDLRWYRRILALRSKTDDLDLGIDRSQAAWESYCMSEIQCSQTNRRLRYGSWEDILPGVSSIISIARRKISRILGPCPALDQLHCRFGPGANVSCRKTTSARHKLSAPLGCSSEGLSSIPALKALYPHLFKDREIRVEIGEVSEVPKNAKTNRTIEFQPLLNTFVQLGIGSYMKRRLVKHGINLFDQTINREWARRASLRDSGIATVDQSRASDCVAVWLVWELLDHEWFDLLSNWRCGTVSVPDRGLQFNLEKFSAMGNGYTFELESVIFYALAYAVCISEGVCPDSLSIYGDDLVVPSVVRERLLEVFAFCGFSVNSEKSYWDGPFRESCGADYFDGVDIRPTYVKSRMTPARLTRLHNDLYRSGDHELAKLVASHIPSHLRLYGPDGFGDGHLLGNYERRQKRKHRASGYGGHVFQSFVKLPKRDRPGVEVPGDALLPMYSAYLRDGVGRMHRQSRLSFAEARALTGVDLKYQCDGWADFFPQGSEPVFSRDMDPYTLRGGERCKKINIYVLAS